MTNNKQEQRWDNSFITTSSVLEKGKKEMDGNKL